jgi:5-methyltetrahydropteroyltriglutamate--homocysteine methyltransferase
VEVRDVEFLRRNTDRMIKMTVPGPFTMSQQAQNDFYGTRRRWRSTMRRRQCRDQ